MMEAQFADYQLEGELRRGASATVHRARDRRDGRVVALKIFDPAALGPGVLDDHHRREVFEDRRHRILALNAAGHPHLVELLAIDEAQGRIYVAMELLEGISLGERLEAGPIPWPDAVAWTADALEALQACHDHGLAHGGVDASHLVPGGDGTLKLLPPALVPVASDAAERPADVFAMGCVLHHLLTAAPPFGGVRSAPAGWPTTPPAGLGSLEAAAPPEIREILRELRTIPGSTRPPAARELADRLRQVVRSVSAADQDDATQIVEIVPPGAPPAGMVIAGYEITRELGRGGMGVVYEARDRRLERPLALKMVRTEVLGDTGKERFLQEARACSRINHPNIVTVYASGEENGDPYLAMELLSGRTLKQILQEEPVAVDRALDWVIDVLDALDRLHRIGIVHRDLKPDNIMLTDDGIIKLMDFGLASMESAPTLTSAGTTVGTVHYMAPEQAAGHKATPASDVFSMGVVLYELLTRKRPFTGEHPMAVLYAIQHRDPTPVADLDPTLPGTLSRVLDRALVKDPTQRFASAGPFRDALRDCRAGATTNASGSRRRWPMAAAGLAAVVLAGTLAVVLTRPGGAPNDRDEAIQLNELGQDYQSQGKITEARAAYRRAILADRSYAIPLNNLAMLAVADSNQAEADSLLRRALEIDPRYAAAHFNLAYLQWERGDLDGAERSYRAAIAADAEFTPAYVNLGALLLDRGRLDDAAALLDRGLSIEPDNAHLLRHRGRAAALRGNAEEAIADWKRALAVAPDDLATHLLLARLLQERGDTAQARPHWETLLHSGDASQREEAAAALAGDGP